MAINRQIWINMIKEGFYPNRSVLNESVDMTEFVEYNKINLAEAGVAPNVLVDNAEFPVPAAERTDNPLELPLHTFDTENTIVRNIEEKETSYNKMDSVVRQHRQTLLAKTLAYALHAWAPQANATLTPVTKTAATGKISFEDILNMDAFFRSHDVDPETLVAVLNPYHMKDLMAEDMKLYKEVMTDNKIFGFKLYQSSQLPVYLKSGDTKVEFGTPFSGSTHVQSSLFYSKNEVMRADGDIEVFAKYKDPGERGDVIGFQKRFTALPIRSKFQAVIINKTA